MRVYLFLETKVGYLLIIIARITLTGLEDIYRLLRISCISNILKTANHEIAILLRVHI